MADHRSTLPSNDDRPDLRPIKKHRIERSEDQDWRKDARDALKVSLKPIPR